MSLEGLRALAKRDGVNIKPTLLRVLTDLYVQSPLHSADEERQFVELMTRLAPEVDEATRATARVKLSAYGRAPLAVLRLLSETPANDPPAEAGITPPGDAPSASLSDSIAPRDTAYQKAPMLDASRISRLFFASRAEERAVILHNLEFASLTPALPPAHEQTQAAIIRLEQAALGGQKQNFIDQLADFLDVDTALAARIANDAGGEPLACVARAIGMPRSVFHRVLMFLDPVTGVSVPRIENLMRLFDTIAPRAAMVMLGVMRSTEEAAPAAPVKARSAKPLHQTVLYDDSASRARPAAAQRPASERAPQANPARNHSRG